MKRCISRNSMIMLFISLGTVSAIIIGVIITGCVFIGDRNEKFEETIQKDKFDVLKSCSRKEGKNIEFFCFLSGTSTSNNRILSLTTDFSIKIFESVDKNTNDHRIEFKYPIIKKPFEFHIQQITNKPKHTIEFTFLEKIGAFFRQYLHIVKYKKMNQFLEEHSKHLEDKNVIIFSFTDSYFGFEYFNYERGKLNIIKPKWLFDEKFKLYISEAKDIFCHFLLNQECKNETRASEDKELLKSY